MNKASMIYIYIKDKKLPSCKSKEKINTVAPHT